MNNPIKISDTTFRDAQQSLLATRLSTDHMLELAEKMDSVGFYSMEVWGGATFDASIRYLNEDPWERLKILKQHIKNTSLSMLLRGQSLVGYRSYADDVVQAFIEQSSESGIDIFRVFDALNDPWNLETAAESIKNQKKHLQLTICYSTIDGKLATDPIYNLDYYLEKTKQFIGLGADSVCIKDMGGLLNPYDAFDLISSLKSSFPNLKLQLHTHYTSGMASMTLLKAIEAGIDIVDTCLAPLALRTSQPAIEPLCMTLAGKEKDPEFDMDIIIELDKELESLLKKHNYAIDNSRSSVIDVNVLKHQIPGGMYSNLISQLSELEAIEKLEDVLQEIPKTRADLGFPPLVTPISQMVGSQSVNNVLFGRYQMVTDQVKDFVAGKYGRPPAIEVENFLDTFQDNPELRLKKIDKKPSDSLKPEMENAEKQILDISSDIQDVLTYVLYPAIAIDFLKSKFDLSTTKKDKNPEDNIQIEPILQKPSNLNPNARSFNVYIDDEMFIVEVEPNSNQVTRMESETVTSESAKPEEAPLESQGEIKITAPMPGVLIKYLVDEGESISKGQSLLILEAMKMENSIPSPVDGIVKEINCEINSRLTKDQLLMLISPES
ncbi:MAG: pyruvate carboxylase subunit B [Dehalococcoidia bacterium]